MGRHYRSNTEGGSIGFLKAMWTSARVCQWVEPSKDAEGEGKGVHFYRNRNGYGTPPTKVPAVEPKVGNAKIIVGADDSE